MTKNNIKIYISHSELSHYCINERLKWLNVLNERELRKIKKEQLESNKNLSGYIEYIDSDESLTPPIINTFKEIINTSQFSILRYCPVCIKEGIHHLYQQNNCFRYCLIHGEKLISNCMQDGCNMLIKYQLKSHDKNNNRAFCCDNGHCLLDESSKSHLIKTWKNERRPLCNIHQYDYNNTKEKWLAIPNNIEIHKLNQETMFGLLTSIHKNKEYQLQKTIKISRNETESNYISRIAKADFSSIHKLCMENVSNLIIETILAEKNLEYREKLFDIILHPSIREDIAKKIIQNPNLNFMFRTNYADRSYYHRITHFAGQFQYMYIEQDFFYKFIEKYFYKTEYKPANEIFNIFYIFCIYVLNEGLRQTEENDETWKPFIINSEMSNGNVIFKIYTPIYRNDVLVKKVFNSILNQTEKKYEELVKGNK
ncbi:hypothetical protein ACWOBH_11130 [Globicatella sanguinis]